jgi:phage tail-like protein
VKETTGDWKDFPEGVPHPSDWQKSVDGSLDFLVSGQPPGRYLFVRVRLTGDGNATPRVRRVRLDFPRATSLDLLPAVYRENPDAEDFTERFLSLFDSTVGDIDRGIERYAALLDPEGVPEEVLPWLGSILGVAFDRSWSAEQRRAILRAVPELYRRRGTVEGLSAAIRLVFGFDPIIEELAAQRMWGALASKTAKKKDAKGDCTAKEPSEIEKQCERSLGARVGEVRLFGRASARFRVGGSSLGRAPLLSFGNPDNDPLNESAYRFRVLVPPQPIDSALWRERLQQLVESQKPAHTVATVRVGGGGFVLGTWSSVGVDTSLTPTPAPVLGREGNVRLRRMSVLWPGRTGRREGVAVGETAVVGMQIVME